MGDLPSVVRGTNGDVHLGLGYIHTYVDSFLFHDTSCELLAHPYKMRALLA